MASKSIEDLKTNPHLNEEMLKVVQNTSQHLLHPQIDSGLKENLVKL